MPGFIGSANARSYNPADPDWFIEVDGSNLVAKHTDGRTRVLSSVGTYENDPSVRKTPAWSANGEHAIFVEGSGGSRKLVSMKVLDESFAPLPAPIVNCEVTGNVSSAQLSPEGKWIYFLRGGQLFRAVNTSGSTGVNISQRISGSLNGYVISP